MNDYGQIVKELTRPFIAHPEAITTFERKDGQYTSLVVQCHKTDIKPLIGMGAKMVRSLQTILRRAAHLRSDRIWFEIMEPQVGEPEPENPFKPKEQWSKADDEAMADILRRIAPDIFGCDHCIHSRSEPNRTVIHVHLEKSQPIDLQAALQVVFRAIGKGMGRQAVLLHVESPAPSKS